MKKTLFMLCLSMLLVLTGCTKDLQQEDITSITRGEEALNVALEQKGKSYVWGARGPEYFDCSGLITYSYKKAYGKDYIFKIDSWITNDATMQDLYNWNVKLKPLEEIEAGDIIFMTREEGKITHGAMFIKWVEKYNKLKFIHASGTSGKVVIDTWNIGNMDQNLKFVNVGRFKATYY